MVGDFSHCALKLSLFSLLQTLLHHHAASYATSNDLPFISLLLRCVHEDIQNISTFNPQELHSWHGVGIMINRKDRANTSTKQWLPTRM